jgi:hypothetical protein
MAVRKRVVELHATLRGTRRTLLSTFVGRPRRGFAWYEAFDDGDERLTVRIERLGARAGCAGVSILIGGARVFDMDLRNGSGLAWLVRSRGAVIPRVSHDVDIGVVSGDSVLCSGRFRSTRVSGRSRRSPEVDQGVP